MTLFQIARKPHLPYAGSMRRLFKNMSIYGLGGLSAHAIQFGLLPVYTRFLAPSDYGALELINMVGAVLGLLFGLMVSSGFLRCYYDRKDMAYREELMQSALSFTLFCCICFGTIIFILAEVLASQLFHFEGGALYLRLIACSGSALALSQLFYNLLMAQEKAKKYVLIKNLTAVVLLILSILLVGVFKLGVTGVLTAQLVTFIVELITLFALLLRKQPFSIRFLGLKDMLVFSVPLIPLQVFSFVLTLTDRFLLQEFQSLSDVGLYSLAFKLSMILTLLINYPLKAFGPHIFALIENESECKKQIADFTRYSLIGSIFLALGLSCFSPEILTVISDKEYFGSNKIIYMLCLSSVFMGVFNISAYAINIVNKNWVMPIFWAAAAAINLLLNYFLIPNYGITGAAVATLLSYSVILLGNAIAIQLLYPCPFQYLRFVELTFFTSFLYWLSIYCGQSTIQAILLKGLLLALFVAYIWIRGAISHKERDSLWSFCKALRN